MGPEHQEIGKCFELREQCQRAIFDKMDEHHKEQMAATGDQTTAIGKLGERVGSVENKMAFQNGQESGRASQAKIGSPAFKFLMLWGGPLLFLLLIGAAAWLKHGGWL